MNQIIKKYYEHNIGIQAVIGQSEAWNGDTGYGEIESIEKDSKIEQNDGWIKGTNKDERKNF